MPKAKAPPMEVLNFIKEMYTYDDGTIYRIMSKGNEKEAGSFDCGYIRIGLTYGGVYYRLQAHHVAWLLNKGYWPEQLDHEDRNRMNNRIGNLREATFAENNTNKIMPNPHKWIGVTKYTSNGYTYYIGRFTHKGKRYGGTSLRCPTAAAISREKRIIEIGASFTVRNFS